MLLLLQCATNGMPSTKKKTTKTPFKRPILRSQLGNDALSLIAQFVIKHKNSCEEMEAFLPLFAKPGIWHVVAQSLRWGSQVMTRNDFVERCYKERQNRLASQYDGQKRLTQAELSEEWTTPWEKTNAWVVPGLVFYENISEDWNAVLDEYIIKAKKGKQKVIIGLEADLNSSDKIGIAMMRTGPCGTEYMVTFGRKCAGGKSFRLGFRG